LIDRFRLLLCPRRYFVWQFGTDFSRYFLAIFRRSASCRPGNAGETMKINHEEMKNKKLIMEEL
jgi:hypothetical protein